MSPKPGPPYLPGMSGLPPLSQHLGKMPQGIPGLPIPLGGAAPLSAMTRPNGLHYPPPPGVPSMPPVGLGKLNLPTPPPLVSLPNSQPGLSMPSYPAAMSQSAASSPPSTDSRGASSYSSSSKPKEPSSGSNSRKSSPGLNTSAASSPPSATPTSKPSQGQRRPRSPSEPSEEAVSPKRPRSGSPQVLATSSAGPTTLTPTLGHQDTDQAGSDTEVDVGDVDATVVDQEIHRSKNAM